MSKILLVEDERVLAETIRYNLAREGLQVELARDGEDGLARFRAARPDLVLLDLMLPKLDGFEVCRQMRRESAVPIIMLTARAEESDRIVGLELGADDYLAKPFSPNELVARVRAVLRRAQRGSAPLHRAMAYGPIVVDPERHTVSSNGSEVTLTAKEFLLLEYLLQHRGRVLSRDVLLTDVWGYSAAGDTRTVDVHVRWLREKIEAEPSRPRLIETVRGLGYRFAS